MKRKQRIEASNIDHIRKEFERRLLVLRYSPHTIRNYLTYFGWLQGFLEDYGEKDYSKEFGQRFLAEFTLQAHHSTSCFSHAKIVIHRLNEIIDGKSFAPRFCEPKPECPPQFSVHYELYCEHLKQLGSAHSTIGNHKRHVGRMLSWLVGVVPSLSSLTSADIYGILTNHAQHTGFMPVARRFLNYLFDNKVTKTNLSDCIPKMRQPQPMPSVYSGEEVSKLLSSIDRSTSMGKRDYAILLLAAKLGLRSSDIVNLKLQDIDYDKKTIDIIQVKTGKPLTLVLNADVEESLDEYVKHGRPQSEHEHVFLNTQAPYSPLCAGTGYSITQRSFDRAGISATGRRRGTHALRMSYATSLVTKGVPYAVVTEALGHDDPESAKYYVRVDVRRLRLCALNVPKPSGALAVNLMDMEGRL
ncbi:MAG: tyrosine-type recombinase/integrase [Synergistaceae bacterium]|nr:tyrosine-type recombinase/integrase [Synergistaceae bacterium]